jgi:hypothetical protein
MNELHKACATGDLKKIIQLLAQQHKINALHTDLGTSPLCFALESGHVQATEHLFRCGAKIVVSPDLVGNESVFTWINECREGAKRKQLLTWLQNNASNPVAFAGACPFTPEEAAFALSLATKKKKQRVDLCKTLNPGDDTRLRLAADHFRMEVHQTDVKQRMKAEVDKCVLALEMIDKVKVKTAADIIIQERLYFFLMTNPLIRDNPTQLFSFKFDWVKCMDELQKCRKFYDDDFIPLAYNLHFIGLNLIEQDDQGDDQARLFLKRAVLAMQQVGNESDENLQSLGNYLMDYAGCLYEPENDEESIAQYRLAIKAFEKIQNKTKKNKHTLARAYANLADKIDTALKKPTKTKKAEIESLFTKSINLLNQLLFEQTRKNNDNYHRSLGRTSFNFASVLYQFEKPSEAAIHYRAAIKAIKSVKQKTEEDVSTLVKVHRDYGRMLSKQGMDAEGVAQHKLAMAICRNETESVYEDLVLNVAAEMATIYSDKSKNLKGLDQEAILMGLECAHESAELGIEVFEAMEEKDEEDEQNYFLCLEFLASFYNGRKEHASAVQCFERALRMTEEAYRVTTLHVWLAYAYFESSQFSLGFDSVETAIHHAKQISDPKKQATIALEFFSFADDYCKVRKDKTVSWAERVSVFASACFGKTHDGTCIDTFFILYGDLTNAPIINEQMIEAYALLKRFMSAIMKLIDKGSLILNKEFLVYLLEETNRNAILSLMQVDLVEVTKNPRYFASKFIMFNTAQLPLTGSTEVTSYARMGMKHRVTDEQ